MSNTITVLRMECRKIQPQIDWTNVTALQENTSPARCANNYTLACVKRDVLTFLDVLDGERSYEIFPGFTIFQRRSGWTTPSDESLDAANDTRLDQLITRRLNDYAESVDLRVKLLNPVDTTSRSVGTSVLERILPFLRMSMLSGRLVIR